jgi:hypothetical protein
VRLNPQDANAKHIVERHSRNWATGRKRSHLEKTLAIDPKVANARATAGPD